MRLAVLPFVLVCATAQAELLTDPTFTLPPGTSPPGVLNRWSGDRSLIVGVEQGVTPLDGETMLRANGTTPDGGGGSDFAVWQLVPLIGPNTDRRLIATVHVNRVNGPSVDTLFWLGLEYYAGQPGQFPGVFSGGAVLEQRTELATDNDLATWQELCLSIPIPSTASYAAIELVAKENVSDDSGNEFAGHYFDLASVRLVDLATVLPDATGDGLVELGDYVIWAATFGRRGSRLAADWDGDCEVGAGDYAVWAARSTGGAQVPEPAGWVIGLAGTIGAGLILHSRISRKTTTRWADGFRGPGFP